MKSPAFDYEAPTDLQQALGLLHANEDAKVLAGGQSLLPMLHMRLARPTLLVDINHIAELDYVRAEDGHLAIGALARHAQVLRLPEVARQSPLLREAASQIGHPAIRNRGTVAGSIAHNDPAAELPAVLAALDGEVVVAGSGAAHGGAGAAGVHRRTVRAEDFFITYLTTDLRPDEIVVEVRFPRLPERTGTCFAEYMPRAGDFAVVGVAAALTLDADGRTCADARIALTGVGGTPYRAREAEAGLRGSRLSTGAGGGEPPAAIGEAAAAAAAAIEPDGDMHASARYRRHLARVLTQRALATALSRAATGGGAS